MTRDVTTEQASKMPAMTAFPKYGRCSSYGAKGATSAAGH